MEPGHEFHFPAGTRTDSFGEHFRVAAYQRSGRNCRLFAAIAGAGTFRQWRIPLEHGSAS